MKKSIVFLGGDERMRFAAGYLSDCGFAVSSCFPPFLTEKSILSDTVVLPLPVIKNGFLFSPESDEKISISQLADIIGTDKTVLGGMIDKELEKNLEENGNTVIDYYTDERLLGENAVLTAKAVCRLIEINNINVRDGEIFILGFGRCGKALKNELTKIGGNVTAVTSQSPSDVNFISFNELDNNLNRAKLIINTVASPVLGKEELKMINKDCVIIEIASAPFGVDFDEAEKRNINLIYAPSLPGRFFPKEAGEVIAKTIEPYLRR